MITDEEEFRKHLGMNTEMYQAPIPYFIYSNCNSLTCHMLKKRLPKFNLALVYVYSGKRKLSCKKFSRQFLLPLLEKLCSACLFLL